MRGSVCKSINNFDIAVTLAFLYSQLINLALLTVPDFILCYKILQENIFLMAVMNVEHVTHYSDQRAPQTVLV